MAKTFWVRKKKVFLSPEKSTVKSQTNYRAV